MQLSPQVEDKTALLNYLKKSLEDVKASEKTQLTLIVVWLVDTYLASIGKLEVTNNKEEAARVKAEFLTMFRTPKMSACVELNKNAIYDLLAGHGDNDTIVR